MNSPPRVVIATIMGERGATGVQTHVREVHDLLVSEGKSATVLTPYSWGGHLSVPVFGARRLIDPMSGPASVFWYRHWHYVFLKKALERELDDGGDAVVYAQCSVSARAALEARRGPNQKVFVAIHSDGSQADEWVDKKMMKAGSRLYTSIKDLEQNTLPALDGIVYVSRKARDGMASEIAGIDRVRQAVIPTFVTMPPRPEIAQPPRDLVTVGTFEIAKNHEYLLRVLDAANRKGRRYTLDFIGDGTTRPLLEKATKALSLEEQVRFLGCRRDARSLLYGYKVYVHASLRESLCMAIIEAMGAGIGVVAGRVGGVPELFEPGTEGVFWPVDDPDSSAEILIDLMESPARLAALGAAARLRYERCFDVDVLGPRLEDFLIGSGAQTSCTASPERSRA